MLTIQQFTTFGTKAKYDIVIGLGTYISTCYFRKTEITSYILYNFLVEVWKKPLSGRVIKVEASDKKEKCLPGTITNVCLN